MQFGLTMVVDRSIDLHTPEGPTLFISAAVARTDAFTVIRALLPFNIAALAALLLISYVPQPSVY